MTRRRPFTILAVIALGAGAELGTGCASLWAVSQLTKGTPPLETDGGTETVPLPGVTERLAIHGYLAGKGKSKETMDAKNRTTAPSVPSTTLAPSTALAPPTALALDCTVTQTGPEIRYRSAKRYDNSWKVWTAVAFVLEGALSAWNFYEGVEKLGDQILLGWMTADALGTGILFFVPERDVYEHTRHERTITVRESCPETLTLEAAGRPVPIAPDGTATDVGQKLFDEQMAAPFPALRLRLGGYATELPITPRNRCSWARARANELRATFCTSDTDTMDQGIVDLKLDLALGTATGAGVMDGSH